MREPEKKKIGEKNNERVVARSPRCRSCNCRGGAECDTREKGDATTS